MKFELKPMSFGEVLDGAVKVFRANLLLFLSIEALFSLPAYLLSSWIGRVLGSVKPAQPGAHLRSGFVFAGLASLLIYVFFFAAWAMMKAAAVQTVTGEPTSVRKALSRWFRVFWPTVGATVIAMIVGGLWGLLLLVPGVIYYLRRSLYFPVLLVEGGTAGNALTRSKVLVMGKNGKGRLDRVFGATVVFGVLSWVVSFGLGMLIPASLKGTVVGSVVNAIPQILTGPLLPISLVLIYFDARVRDEGYDLELRARAAGATPAPPTASLAGAAAPSGSA
jgi:hypothetical protein